MSFEVFDNRPFRSGNPTLTIDKFSRLYVNFAAREKLEINPGEISLYIGYDSVNRRIGVAKPSVVRLVDTRPVKFDKRYYAYVKRFLDQYNIDYSETKRYSYVGNEKGWYMFELEDYDAPDARGQKDKVKSRKNKV